MLKIVKKKKERKIYTVLRYIINLFYLQMQNKEKSIKMGNNIFI